MTDWLFDDSAPTLPSELVDCRTCLDQYLSLKEAMGLFDQASTSLEPAEDYWAGYEATLRVKLAQEQRPSRWQQWFSRPLWLIPAAALLLILMFSLAWSRRASQSSEGTPVQEVASGVMKPGSMQDREGEEPRTQPRNKRKLDKPAKPERKEPSRPPGKKPYMLLDPNPMMALASMSTEGSATIQHLERAQRLLRSFRNSSPTNNTIFDLTYEKKQARNLVYRNILLRREAETRGDWPTEEMLSSLESLLLDIGNLPTRPTADDVDPIKERIQKKEIVARLQLYATPVTVALAE
ncbi:MAG: hypothetical protein JST84_17395 [Acidobacteria bacterium]|nr:hypothetical protein [Acidobacteriota bacterium]